MVLLLDESSKLEILGKGYVGIVVLAKLGNKQVALKIRRLDSQRNEFDHDFVILTDGRQPTKKTDWNSCSGNIGKL